MSGLPISSLLLFGCGELLGVPPDPYLLQPDAAGAGTELTTPASDDASTQSATDNAASDNAASDRNPTAPASPDSGTSSGVVGDGGTPSNEIIRSSDADAMAIGGGSPSSPCAPLSSPMVSNFTFSPGDSPTTASFGVDAAFVGSTYVYPNGGAVSSDVTGDDWHLSGMVNTASGFGLFSSACSPLDISAFAGISFTLSGSIEAGRELVFFVEGAAQQVSYVWQNANEQSATEPDIAPNAGRCIPATTRYDGTCREPRVLLAVPPLSTTIEIAWTDLLGGSPVASVDPTEITSIAWALPQPAPGAYALDLHIDDVRFIAP